MSNQDNDPINNNDNIDTTNIDDNPIQTEEANTKNYGLSTGIIAFFLALGSILLISFVMGFIVGLILKDSAQEIIRNKIIVFLALIITDALMFFVVFFIIKKKKLSFKKVLKLNPPKKKSSYLFAVLGLIGVRIIINLLWDILSPIIFSFFDSGASEVYNKLTNNIFIGNSAIEIILLSLFIVIGAGIFEEILFRGLILSSFRKKCKPVGAIIFSSILFGIIHLNVTQYFYGFFLGLYLGYLVYKTNSIYPAILVHILNNLLVIVALFLL